METIILDGEDANISLSMENGNLKPVLPDASGVGLPYAPENFPNEGDNWRWKVGKRVNISGYYRDRYIYPPERFWQLKKETTPKHFFTSKAAVKRFVQAAIPGADIDALFESFSWKIPSENLKLAKASNGSDGYHLSLEVKEDYVSNESLAEDDCRIQYLKLNDKETGNLKPVLPEASGVGLPYAPENFPNKGDNWRWKVGKRVNINGGYYHDRYIYPPERFRQLEKRIASKAAVKRFVQAAIPGADIDVFFESFTWNIPSKKLKLAKGSVDKSIILSVPHEEHSPYQTATDSNSCCKAHNRTCSSLSMERNKPAVMPCDICCSEPGFCRDCCCILCSKTVDNAYGGYSYVQCEALVGDDDDYICGHVAHLDCAVRLYMAGTVGGSIGLDAEYYCRRCDAKKELISHAAKLLKTCKSICSYDDLERVLNVGACVLHGSQKTSAKSLLAQIYQTLTKLKHGVALEDIWNQDNDSASNGGGNHDSLEVREDLVSNESSLGEDDCRIQYLKLDDEVDKALEALRMAQESEYKAAEERFHEQRNYLHNLYQQLEHESFELRKRRLSPKAVELMRVVSDRKVQIQREFKKLKGMKQVAAKGFGRASRDNLRDHFALEPEQLSSKAKQL